MKYSKFLFFIMVIGTLFCSACTNSSTTTTNATPSPTVPLKVFAAASLTEVFQTMAQEYHKTHNNIAITFNFAGSQALEQQLANGAPGDIFASADTTNMQKAQDANLVKSSQIFARNKLVVIIPANNPANITSLKDLTKKGVKIDIGAPTVPAGKYTLQILDKMTQLPEYGPTYKQDLQANVVSQEDNVKAVVNKVQLAEADAGFVYETDVTSALRAKVKIIDIPDNINVTAQYPIATVQAAKHQTESQAFIHYILSPAGQTILTKQHFLGAQP